MGESPELDDPALAVLSRLAVHSRSSTESFAFMAVNWFNDFSIHFRPVTFPRHRSSFQTVSVPRESKRARGTIRGGRD